MTERPEDASYGLILIQGTLQDSLPPRCHSLTSASSCYGSTLGSSACLVTSLRCVCSLLRSGSRVFSCRRWHSGTLFSVPQYWRNFLELAKARTPRFWLQCDCLLNMQYCRLGSLHGH